MNQKIKSTLLTAAATLLLGLAFPENVNADTYTIDNYTIVDEAEFVVVTDNQTGLYAYLNKNTGEMIDVDGSVSYVIVNPVQKYSFIDSDGLDLNLIVNSSFRRGVWNYVTSNTYNLGHIQSIQSFVAGLLALIPSPASFPLGVVSSALGGASLVNGNVTVRITQYYDPAQASKIREDIVTYKNGRQIGSSSIVRTIF